MKKLVCFAVMFFLVSVANAATLQEKNGNLFYVKDGKTKQLTNLDRDREPVLHPKGEWVYFVRQAPGKWKGEKYYPPKGFKAEDGILKEEIWRVKIDGTSETKLFQSTHAAIDGPDPDYSVATVSNIQFSPSGDMVYFEASEWVTSAALHAMSPDGAKEQMLGPGNDTRIIQSARTFDDREKSYEGYIVTAQHRYWFYGGSYDWYYLFTPDLKKEIAPLGDDPVYFTEMGDIKYTDHSEKKLVKAKETAK